MGRSLDTTSAVITSMATVRCAAISVPTGEKTLMTGCSSLGEEKKLLENAQHSFDNAQSLHRHARARDISDTMAELMMEMQRIAA